MAEYKWMKIDTPSIMFSCLSTKKWGRTFRIAVVLKDAYTVDIKLLETAVADLRGRFAHYYSKLKKGFFWNYLELVDGLPEIRDESNGIGVPIALRDDNRPDFRIVYSAHRIGIEITHYITDGYGALTYLLALTQRYLELAENLPSEPRSGIQYWQTPATPAQTADDFLHYGNYDGEKVKNEKVESFRLQPKCEKDFLRLTYFEMSAQQAQTEARAMQLTLTEFMSAALILAIIRTAKTPVDNNIDVEIPVNLRSFFESQTLRNFVFQVSTLFPANGKQDWTLEEIADVMRGQIRAQLNPAKLQAVLKGLTGLATNPVVRLVPNFIKTPVLRVMQARSHSNETTILTNLGRVSVADDIAEKIERMEFVNGDTSGYGLPATCASVSFNDRFVFCISSNSKEDATWNELEKILNDAGISLLAKRVEETHYQNVSHTSAAQKRFTTDKCKAYFHF